MKFNLLNNALDSLNQVVVLLAVRAIEEDNSRFKQAILGLTHCIELLLKERLRMQCPALIWERKKDYPNLDGRTVNASTAIKRLKAVVGVEFSEQDENMLESLRHTRNAIEHYEWEMSEQEAKIIVGSALSFILSFGYKELQIDLSDSYKEDDTWKMLLDEASEFANAHGERLKAVMLENNDFPQYCNQCQQETVSWKGGSCSLCGHWQTTDYLEQED